MYMSACLDGEKDLLYNMKASSSMFMENTLKSRGIYKFLSTVSHKVKIFFTSSDCLLQPTILGSEFFSFYNYNKNKWHENVMRKNAIIKLKTLLSYISTGPMKLKIYVTFDFST